VGQSKKDRPSGKDKARARSYKAKASSKKQRAVDLMRTTQPGLNGDYRGACVVCLKGTDTALAFRGEAEWTLAGLMRLGLPKKEAYATLEAFLTEFQPGHITGMVPPGVIAVPVQVCRRCAGKVKTAQGPCPVALLHPGGEMPYHRSSPTSTTWPDATLTDPLKTPRLPLPGRLGVQDSFAGPGRSSHSMASSSSWRASRSACVGS
jgi:hypothetical protein